MPSPSEVENIVAELKAIRNRRYTVTDQIQDLYNRKSVLEREAHDLEAKIHQTEAKLSNAIADEARTDYECAKPGESVG